MDAEMQVGEEQQTEETALREGVEPAFKKRKLEDSSTESPKENEPAEEPVTKDDEATTEAATEMPSQKQEENADEQEEENGNNKETVEESSIPSSPRKQGSYEYDKLKWVVVRNDGKPESMIKLIGLKSLFAKQLPKMPRSYIARLVLDRRHTSIAILQDKPELKNTDDEIIGGICYRAFPEMRLAEIAFCAVNANHQVKGYGSKLMNLFKNHAVQEGIEYFITYADNYAIGYFKKQGFSKTISMPKGRYSGLIKEYDGGTPMECYVHPSIDYTRIPELVQAQKDFIMSRIRLTAQSHIVYDPLPPNFASAFFDGASSSSSRGNHNAARALQVPGMIAAGWTLNDLRQRAETQREIKSLKSDLLQMVHRIKEQQFAWPFLEPVDTKDVPDYLDVITKPIDLATIEKRIRSDNHYRTKEMFFADIQLMADNCKTYNDDGSMYVQCAKKLEKFLNDKLK
ncbi:histone acetyltransferase [Fistulifera solaris]|uniref:histone acetyltransferase n=1 Tax=Fistulifera solaris TaxID=1519565 RepID=A0A1Z5KNF0_FISSO|nr:histone acetyltransferase [Fistulifera solaris]|eukprot:GAX27816.1 histone acetyltransferase [Fistulifera solaris]